MVLLVALLLVQSGVISRINLSGSDSTQYGETLNINVSVGGETLEGSWSTPSKLPAPMRALITAQLSADASQNIYTVNSSYYNQQKVQYSVTVSVTGTQVQNVQLANLTLKCIDAADGSKYNWLAVLSQDITLPYSHEWTGWQYISDHLTNVQASTTDATIQYKVYAKVTAIGSVSGQTLTAQTGGGQFTQFTAYHFVYVTEGTSTTVTPSVSPASWTDMANVGLLIGICIELGFVAFYVRDLRRSRV